MATSKAEKFIMSTDFATIKNDSDVATTTLTVPGSQNVAGASLKSWSEDIVIGTVNAPMTFYLKHSANNKYYNCFVLDYIATGTVSGSSATYDVGIFVYRLNTTTVRLTASIYNPYGTTLTTEATSRTVSLYVRTYLTPFN